jgi:hypothetical protein
MKIELGSTGSVVQLSGPWQRLQSMPDDPPGSQVCGYENDEGQGMLIVTPLTDGGDFMPLDQAAVLQGIRPALAETGSALIEPETEKTSGGYDFVYTIVKASMEPSGVQYTLTLHAAFAAKFQFQAFFQEQGMTGLREATVWELHQRDPHGDTRAWTFDPYDGSADGFLMNLSEAPEYDVRFPGHPLTHARQVVADIAST